ncbi:MAG: glycosyltransferase [Candidatus Marinimicrobia bacterium]|nr:glycosyltransferase [Candidatus Neomarinimicrobiota bacterium]
MNLFIGGLLVVVTLVYVGFTIVIIRGLFLKLSKPGRSDHPDVAVVIAARNEEQNLPQLLADLAAQNYQGQLDFYIADDRSTDSTWSILEQFSRRHTNLHAVRINALAENMTPKKNALTQCLKQTTAELILTTDADCRVGPGWVASAVSQMDETVGVLVGYSQVEARTIFQRYQALDFIGIMVANAGMMTQGQVWSGSGQNLAYRRSAFTTIGGFNPVAHKISGDDVYLVQAIPVATGLQARFNFEPDHFVQTMPMDTLKAFLSQRIRWSSNSKGLEKRKPRFFAFLLSAFLSNFLLLIMGMFGWFDVFFWCALALKFLAEGVVMMAGAQRFGYGALLPMYPLWFVVQPFYISYVGLMGLRGKFSWKP